VRNEFQRAEYIAASGMLLTLADVVQNIRTLVTIQAYSGMHHGVLGPGIYTVLSNRRINDRYGI
jgi:hypothetical protein